MKLYSLSVFHKGDASDSDNNKAPPRLLKAAYSLSSFGFFQRSGAREFMAFTSALLAERCCSSPAAAGGGSSSRASVREKDYRCHVHARNDGMAAVLIADAEYPQRVCFTLLEKALDDFSSSSVREDTTTSYNEGLLDAHLARYQDPREADALTRARAELDETRVILHDTVESLLERGERLDDLVAKSEHLRFQSKVFYRNARRKNECCAVM